MAARGAKAPILLWPAGLSLLALLLPVGLSFAALALAAGGMAWPGQERVLRVLGFTFLQAGLSTLLSLGLGLLVGRSLFWHRARSGTRFCLWVIALAPVLPTLVAILGVAVIHGRGGWLAGLGEVFGLGKPGYLYGLTGILLAHLLFNLPLAARVSVAALAAVPEETWRLARHLGLSPWSRFRLVEWPVLRRALPGVAGLIFLLCFTSFAVVLALGGGPAAATLEVAIYQALRFDFDLGLAVALSLLQILCCGAILLLLGLIGPPLALRATERPRWEQAPPLSPVDVLAFAILGVLVLLPLLAVLVKGLAPGALAVFLTPGTWRAWGQSLAVALPAGLLGFLLALGLMLASRDFAVRRPGSPWARLIEVPGYLVLVVPPLTLGAGLFLLIGPGGGVFTWAPVLIVAVNAVMAVPFVLAVLGPPMKSVAASHDRLCRSLGIGGWRRLKLIEAPLLAAPARLALALATALSLGDFSVIALFGSQDFETLPLRLYRQLGSYRTEAAAGTALLLVASVYLAFKLIEGKRSARP